MNENYLVLYLFSITTCVLVEIVAHEAIVGGYVVTAPGFLYHVTILIAYHEPRCGGSILADYYVLTAAHCVIAADNRLIGRPISVLANTYDLEKAGLVVEVEKIFYPAEYDSRITNPIGDIAVLKLKKSLRLEGHILKKLQLQHNKTKGFYDGQSGRIAGSGWDMIYEKNELIGDYTDHQLRFAIAVIINQTQCQQEHPHVIITDSHICAKVIQDREAGPRNGVCIGDGGGSLVVNGKVAVGVLSVSTIGCSEKTSSGIYTSILHYRKFIHETLRDKRSLNVRIFSV